jgi:hypothetical protein
LSASTVFSRSARLGLGEAAAAAVVVVRGDAGDRINASGDCVAAAAGEAAAAAIDVVEALLLLVL